jgi:hypothetical protein
MRKLFVITFFIIKIFFILHEIRGTNRIYTQKLPMHRPSSINIPFPIDISLKTYSIIIQWVSFLNLHALFQLFHATT